MTRSSPIRPNLSAVNQSAWRQLILLNPLRKCQCLNINDHSWRFLRLSFVTSIGFLLFLSCIILAPSRVSAQSTVEYGTIIGSKPPPKPMNVMKGSEQITKPEAVKTSSGKTQKKKTTSQAKTGSKGSGPLILEKRGSHYERVN